MDDKWKREYDAPSGQIWVCTACGRKGPNRVDIGDESCFLNASLFPEELLGVSPL